MVSIGIFCMVMSWSDRNIQGLSMPQNFLFHLNFFSSGPNHYPPSHPPPASLDIPMNPLASGSSSDDCECFQASRWADAARSQYTPIAVAAQWLWRLLILSGRCQCSTRLSYSVITLAPRPPINRMFVFCIFLTVHLQEFFLFVGLHYALMLAWVLLMRTNFCGSIDGVRRFNFTWSQCLQSSNIPWMTLHCRACSAPLQLALLLVVKYM